LVDPVKPTLRRAPPDPAVIDADSGQLPPAHNTMLPGRQRAEPDIRVCAENLSLRA
jgi:hypothetical protein